MRNGRLWGEILFNLIYFYHYLSLFSISLSLHLISLTFHLFLFIKYQINKPINQSNKPISLQRCKSWWKWDGRWCCSFMDTSEKLNWWLIDWLIDDDEIELDSNHFHINFLPSHLPSHLTIYHLTFTQTISLYHIISSPHSHLPQFTIHHLSSNHQTISHQTIISQ